MNILYLKRLIGTQVLAQAGDEHIEAAAQEVVIVTPDLLQDIGTLKHLVGAFGEQLEQVCLFLGELQAFIVVGKGEILVVKLETAQPEPAGRTRCADLAAAQEYLYLENELFYTEGFGNVIVGTEAQAVQAVFLERFRGQEKYGDLRIIPADLPGYRKAIYLRKHHIQDTKVEVLFVYLLQCRFAIRTMCYFIPLQLEVVPRYEAQAFIIFNV